MWSGVDRDLNAHGGPPVRDSRLKCCVVCASSDVVGSALPFSIWLESCARLLREAGRWWSVGRDARLAQCARQIEGRIEGQKVPRAARAHSEAARDEARPCQLGKSVNSFPVGEWFFGMDLLCARRGQVMRVMRRTACGEAASGSVGDGEAGRDLVAGDPPQ